MLQLLADKLLSLFGDRRRVRVLVHRATFESNGQPAFFINVTNVSRNREVEITHVYFDLGTRHVAALQPARKLPRRLKSDEVWETWVFARELPTELGDELYSLARVRLSTGSVVSSRQNRSVPERGAIPGG